MNPDEKLQEAAKVGIVELASGIFSTSISTEAKRFRMTRIAEDLLQAVAESKEEKPTDQKKDLHFGYGKNDPICYTKESHPQVTSHGEQVTCEKCLYVLAKYETYKKI